MLNYPMEILDKTYKTKYSTYIRWSVFELACFGNINHWNYDGSNELI